jgi:solute carrier family 34 (sodium-dependent phosphate cotransporter)
VVAVRKVLVALLAISTFIFAIELLKTGAKAIAPIARDVFQVGDPLNALGFGWALAYLVLSGSPIAATALGLYAADPPVLTEAGAYMMIAGSRLGASFIVLLIVFIYTLQKEHRHHGSLSLHAGVLSLLVTYTIYAPGIILGFFLLESKLLAPYAIDTPPRLLDFIEAIFGTAAAWVSEVSPHPFLVFLLGLVAVLVAFKLFDHALPDIQKRAGKLGKMAERIYRPSVLFAFGFLVTLVTLSVSVSLSILVPMTVKGIIRRENLIPYIMGANVSTFIDTLFAAVVVGGAAAFTVVLAEMVGVAVVSLLVIALAYSYYEEMLYRASHLILRDRRVMAAFLMVILICPVVLLLL